MIVRNCQLLGIDIGSETISICRADYSGNLYSNVAFNLPDPPMPGAVTVAISDYIVLVDPYFKADLVGVSFLGEIDSTERILKSCTHLSGWLNVPFADWLEIRISRKVKLVSSIKCLQVSQKHDVKNNDIDKGLLSSIGAALLAYERFKCFLD